MTYYVPGTEEKDPAKIIMSLQQVHGTTATNTTNIATNTTDIATNTTNIATNTANIATNTAAIAKLTNNQFARVALSTANQSIVIGSAVKIQFNTSVFDLSSIWDAVNYRFKPTIAGYYRLSWAAQMTYTGGNNAFAALYSNAARYAIGSVSSNAATFTDSTGLCMVHFNGSSDYAEIFATIATGAAGGAVVAGTDLTYFEISLVKAD